MPSQTAGLDHLKQELKKKLQSGKNMYTVCQREPGDPSTLLPISRLSECFNGKVLHHESRAFQCSLHCDMERSNGCCI